MSTPDVFCDLLQVLSGDEPDVYWKALMLGLGLCLFNGHGGVDGVAAWAEEFSPAHGRFAREGRLFV